MRREQVVSAIRAQPFRPFRVKLTNGDMHEVRHSEMAMLVAGTLIIGYPDPADQGRDRFAIVDLSHMAELDREAAPLPPTNGDTNGA
jgi:hypothetical protein